MSDAPLQPGELLQDVYSDELILLIRKKDFFYEEEGEIWDFLNLTAGCYSWWYESHLEDEQDFRRL